MNAAKERGAAARRKARANRVSDEFFSEVRAPRELVPHSPVPSSGTASTRSTRDTRASSGSSGSGPLTTAPTTTFSSLASSDALKMKKQQQRTQSSSVPKQVGTRGRNYSGDDIVVGGGFAASVPSPTKTSSSKGGSHHKKRKHSKKKKHSKEHSKRTSGGEEEGNVRESRLSADLLQLLEAEKGGQEDVGQKMRRVSGRSDSGRRQTGGSVETPRQPKSTGAPTLRRSKSLNDDRRGGGAAAAAVQRQGKGGR